MAGDVMSVSYVGHNRSALTALIHAVLTSCMELTALRRICGAGKLALKCNGLALSMRICNGYCGEKRLSIRMLSVSTDLLGGAHLNDVSEVHYGDLVGDVLNYGKVVGNEYVRHSLLALKLFEKVDDLRLNRNVKCGYGLVANNELGIYRKSSCDTYSLTLTAREFVRISIVMVRLKTASCHYVSYVRAYLGIRNYLMNLYSLTDDRTNGHSGRKRGLGILENELKLGS